MWTNKYEDLLVEWVELRAQAADLPLEDALHLIHDWWWTAPIVNNTIHFTDTENWPGAWDLLAQDAYCDVAKCLGLCYTILLIQHEDINSLHMVQTADCTLVQVNKGQYILNDTPGEITVDQEDLCVTYTFDCDNLRASIG